VKVRAVIGFILLAFAFNAFGQSVEELIELKKREAAKIAAAGKPIPALPTKGQVFNPLAGLQARVKGTFWRDAEWVKTLDLSTAQQARMDDVFQQFRLKLIDLTASLQKEEVVLEPLFSGSRPLAENEARILTQIDKIADTRSELEKANARMLFSILQVLTPEQWGKLPLSETKDFKVKTKPGK